MYKRVVVPLDGSPLAEAILPFITDIAGPLDLEVTLLRVLVPVPPDVPIGEISGSRAMLLDDMTARTDEARAYLGRLADGLQARGIRARADIRCGHPVREILAGAEEASADLIAMSTHGRSGLGRLLFGSVAEAVLREAAIPVFLMRLTEKQLEARVAPGAA